MMSNFNNKLKMLRQERGLSQQGLADEVGMSKSSINMYERGEREPGIETVKRIADFFNVDVDYLFGISEIRKRRGFKFGARIYKNIAYNIQHHREEANLTQKQFADLLGVDESAVVELESGKNPLEKEMLYKICDVLHLIPGNIVPRDEDLTEDEEYLISRREKENPGKIILTEAEKELLEVFRLIPEEQQRHLLETGRLFANSLKKD